MSEDTGYNKDTCLRLLKRFDEIHNVIKFNESTKEVLILNWYKYNWSSSAKTITGVISAAKYIKCEKFRNYVLSVAESVKNGNKELVRYPIEASVSVSVSDTVSDSVAETDTVNNKKNITGEDIKKIVTYLNKKCGTHYRCNTANTRKHITARFADGYTVSDFMTVIDKKSAEWQGTKFELYLRPDTLFGSKFESYLNQQIKQKDSTKEFLGGWGLQLMTEKEVRQLLAMTQAVYPNYNPPSREAAVNAWLMCLSEYDNKVVQLAFKTYMTTNTSGFPPVPGQLVEILQSLTQPQELNELEAWSLVRQALKDCNYNSEQEFAKLPTIIQKTVGTPQQLRIWASDTEFNENVVSSNFIKTYRTEVKRATELNKMPSDVRKLIEMVNTNSVSAQIASENKKSISLSLEDKKIEETGKMEVRNSVTMPEKYKKEFGIK